MRKDAKGCGHTDTVHTLLHAAEMTNAHQLRNVCMHFLRNDSSAETNSGRVSEEKGASQKVIL